MRTRALARAAASVDVEARTFSAILTTETPVRTWIPDPSGTPDAAGSVGHIEVDEVLLTAGLDASRAERMPLLACHSTWSLDDYLGQVTDVRSESVDGFGACVVIDAQFKPSKAEMASDLAAGFYPNMSAGYVVTEYEVEIREGQVPLARATKWTLLEGSLVPIGADPNARIRSGNPAQHPLPAVRLRGSTPTNTRGKRMDINDLVDAAEDAIEKLVEAAERAGDDLDEETAGRIRKLRGEADEDATERKRGKRKKREDDDEDASERKRSKRSDDDADERSDEDDAQERKRSRREDEEVEGVRSLAKTYGRDVVKVVDDLKALGARASEIRAAVRSAVVARAGASAPSGTVAPANGQRSGSTELSHRDAFAGLRGAFKR